MDRLRAGLLALWQTTLALWNRATNGSTTRQRAFAVGGAVLALLIISGIVFTSMAPAPAPQHVAQVAQPTATDTMTPSPTVTATARPTVKPTARPTAKPVPKTPPPPPIPTQPPTSSSSNPTAQFCPTPTPLPAPTATATTVAPTATATTAAPTATASTAPAPTASASTTGGTTTSIGSFVGLTVPSSCVTCPYYTGNNPSQTQIATALANAAAKYGLPVNLLKAVAWQESHWHEDVTSCDGGIGLMQVQYYVYPWLNQESIPSETGCGMAATSYDPYNLQDNAYLGAKMLKYLTCFWSFWGGYSYDKYGNPHTVSNPTLDTIAWYYQQAGLPYPDSSQPNSLCAAVFNQNGYYPALPSSTSQPWPCPFSATAGDTTLLDITISAYNEGAGNVINLGINNMWYVNGVEGYIPQFASGALP